MIICIYLFGIKTAVGQLAKVRPHIQAHALGAAQIGAAKICAGDFYLSEHA